MNTWWLTRRDFFRQLHQHWPTLIVLTFASATAGGLLGLNMNPTSTELFKTSMNVFATMTAIASVLVLWNIWKVSIDLRRSYFDTLTTMGYGPSGIAWLLTLEGAVVGALAGLMGAVGAPAAYQGFSAIFRSAGVPDMPTGQPQWVVVGLIVIALSMVISVLAAVSSTTRVTSDRNRDVRVSVIGKGTIISLALCAAAAACFAYLGAQGSLTAATFLFPLAATLIAPGVILVLHTVAHWLGKAAGYRPFVVLATSREFLHSSAKMSLVLAAFTALFVGLAAMVGSMEHGARINMSSYLKDAHTVVRADGKPVTGQDAMQVCAGGADCQHLVLTEVEGRDSFEGLATAETWQQFFQIGGTLRKLPGQGESVPMVQDGWMASTYQDLTAVPAAQLNPSQAGMVRIFSQEPFMNLPAGFRSVTTKDFTATVGSQELIRGDGESSLLPFFSTIFVVLASFAFGSRYLRIAALTKDNNAALRQGITMKSLLAAEVVSAFTIAGSICVCVAIAAELSRTRTAELIREAGVVGPMADYPAPYLLATFLCLVLAFIAPAPLALRATTTRV